MPGARPYSTAVNPATYGPAAALAGPIWLGDNSSVTKQVIERLYACSHLLNQAGQYAYYALPVVGSADPRTESPR